jgi:hypothetical protein
MSFVSDVATEYQKYVKYVTLVTVVGGTILGAIVLINVLNKKG